MATCGYLCPSCEGKMYKEDGTPCDWCTVKKEVSADELEKWIEEVHQGPCCSDPPDLDEKK